MKKKRLSGWVRLIMLLALALTLTACGAQDGTGPPVHESMRPPGTEASATVNSPGAVEFTCYAADANGGTLKGFRSEVDGNWYLMVPANQQLSELELHYSGEASGTISEAFKNSGDKVEITTADGAVITVVAMQSDLPSVQIYLNNTTLDTIHRDKDVKYKDNTFILTMLDGVTRVEDSVEIKGRGNSTWDLTEKKGYQIKFAEKTSVLGMGEAKKWILLANAFDDSMIRSQLVFGMAEKLDMAFVPDFEYIDLWIDGEYRGTYLIGEKAEISGSRLDLQQDTGALFEHDEGFFEEEDYWFFSKVLQRHFTLKEIKEENATTITAAMEEFEIAVDEFMLYLYNTPSEEVTLDKLSEMIDVDSFAKYYLVNEYVLNGESFVSSFYWYKDGPEDVLHLGPVWDFDTCMGNNGYGCDESYGDSHVLFTYLLASNEFKGRTEELYEQYKNEFSSMTARAGILKEEIQTAAKMNYLRWDDIWGKENPKAPGVNFCNSFEEAVAAVETWLAGRTENFQIADCRTVASTISEDCRRLEITFPDEQYTSVLFAVWNRLQGMEQIQWYFPQLIDGAWRSTVELGVFNAAGVYRMDVYVNNSSVPAATGRKYVDEAVESSFPMEARLSDDSKVMTITLRDNEPCEAVSFMVWSAVNDRDDLKWFPAERDSEGLWSCQVDIALYQDTGKYHIEAYKGVNDDSTLLNVTTINVNNATD